MNCFYCPSVNELPKDLAKHIVEKHPKKHNKWAAKVLTDVTRLNRKADKQSRDLVPLSHEDRMAKASTQHELSGREKFVLCYCPQCKQIHQMSIPVEYLQSISVWIQDNKPVVTCDSCRYKK
jgi:phage FluMu protein Com